MRKLIAHAIGAIATLVLIAAPAADAKSKWADVRAITNSGETLADHRQYTDDVRVRASEDADCFGESNPSSNETYKLEDPTVLGALVDASKVDDDLRPLLITDAFFGSFGSFGVCGIGEFVAPAFVAGDPAEPYWYNAVNGVGASAGPNQIPVSNGDRHLWYFATGAESGFPSELVLKAPARVVAGERFTVRVIRVKSDGSREPAERVTVDGATDRTNSDGKTKLRLEEGTTTVQAAGRSRDVPSAEVSICAAEELSECPRARGRVIFGSMGDDEIRGTRGPDSINCGRGEDLVKDAQRKDDIAESCEKVKR